MKLLYCIPTLEMGGCERQLSYISTELARLGYEVHAAFTRDGPNGDRMRAGGVTLHDIGTGNSYDPRIFVRLVRLISRLQPEIVQTSLMQMDVLAAAAALCTRTPRVLYESSAAPSYPAGWKSSVRRMLGRRAAAIVSNSRGGDDYWRAAGAPRRFIVNSAVPFDEIDRAAPDAGSEPLVLFAGRLDDGKNVGTLVDALSRVVSEVECVAMVCGDGPRRRELERTVAERGLAQRIVFPGTVANVWPLMKRARVFVSLSRYEGSPNVVLEAAACGTPLVLSDIAAHRDLIDDETVSFVDCDDAAGAAEAIRGAMSRGRVIRPRNERDSIESAAREYLAIYEKVAVGK